MTETDMLKSGGLMTVTPVIDGLKDGRAVTFDEREPVAIAHWEAGSLEGPFERRSAATGELLESAFYKKGRLEGERRLYDEKGALLRAETYAGGLLEGSVKTYSPEGVLLSDVEYRAGKRDGKSRRYGPEGRLLEELTFVADVRQGPFALCFEETGRARRVRAICRRCVRRARHDGQADGGREVRSYVRGVETGPVERYDREGRLMEAEPGADPQADASDSARGAPDAPSRCTKRKPIFRTCRTRASRKGMTRRAGPKPFCYIRT